MWVEFVQRSLSKEVLKANLSYTRHFFRHISFVKEFEGEFFICSYDISRFSDPWDNIDANSHAFGVRLALFDPISRYHAIETEYHAFFKILQIEEKVLINLN